MTSDGVLMALSRVSRKRIDEITPHVTLASLGLSSSFGLSAVRSLIEADSSANLPPLTARMTVAELLKLAQHDGSFSHEKEPAALKIPAESWHKQPISPPAALNGLGLGIDMQEIASMPEAADYRTDPFYIGHFLPTELATAVLRPNPRAHLCGVFCAKEAAKKAHPALLNLRMTDMRVVLDPFGKPTIEVASDKVAPGTVALVLSITHTEHYAAATCVSLGGG